MLKLTDREKQEIIRHLEADKELSVSYRETIYDPVSCTICSVSYDDKWTCSELKEGAYALSAPTRLLRCPQRGQVLRQAGAMARSIGLMEKLYEPCYVPRPIGKGALQI